VGIFRFAGGPYIPDLEHAAAVSLAMPSVSGPDFTSLPAQGCAGTRMFTLIASKATRMLLPLVLWASELTRALCSAIRLDLTCREGCDLASKGELRLRMC